MVKSSKVCETWCFALKRFRHKPIPVSPPSLSRAAFCNIKVYFLKFNLGTPQSVIAS
jgi:hypothetical protein